MSVHSATLDPRVNALEQERGPLDPGQRFENFEIVGLLGSGGTAFVYEGYQEFLDRRVAIKVIPGKAEKAAEFRRRARAEAIVLSRIRHPNVVQVFDAGVTSDGALIYIIMERLIGRPLRGVLIALRALSVPEALVVGAQVCDAVEAALNALITAGQDEAVYRSGFSDRELLRSVEAMVRTALPQVAAVHLLDLSLRGGPLRTAMRP